MSDMRGQRHPGYRFAHPPCAPVTRGPFERHHKPLYKSSWIGAVLHRTEAVMTTITRRLFLSLAAVLAPGAAIAHHGWGGYDTSKSFTVTGVILKSAYENPHCEIE